jgi:hypothetical protein
VDSFFLIALMVVFLWRFRAQNAVIGLLQLSNGSPFPLGGKPGLASTPITFFSDRDSPLDILQYDSVEGFFLFVMGVWI